MRTALISAAGAVFLAAIFASATGSAQSTASPAVQTAPASAVASSAPHTAATAAGVMKTYCVTCHNDRVKSGELTLEHAALTNIHESGELWEKVIRKVRAGMMPPAGMPRPDAATLEGFAGYLESSIDRAAAAAPRPGRTALHRLNRAEYANALRDLLALEVDATALLPPDDESSGFDNIADVLSISPSLMERYLSASWNISRLAMGNVAITPSTITYRVRPDLSQDQHIEGLPPGTRGGLLVDHTFPVDGEYVIKLRMWRNTFDLMRGMEDPHDIEIAMDGARLVVVTTGGREDFGKMAENPGTFGADLDRRLTVRLPVKAGTHRIWATSVLKSHAPRDDLIKPFIRTTVDGLDIMGDPSVDRITIEGPFAASGPGESASRRKILSCTPASAAQEPACARQILTSLARQAYRRPVDRASLDVLMDFYSRGRKTGSFDRGIESALQFILASPEFLFRVEPDPPSRSALRRDESASAGRVTPKADPPSTVYRLGDLALASRLSFFLWSSLPDDQLITLAAQGRLRQPAVLEQQVRRMLADPRSKTLIDNFAEQWLHLRNLKNSNPDLAAFPDFDDNLRQSMKEETELFFNSIMREDRSVMDLLNADYTFVNERLARHYGMPRVYGSRFRRVQVPDHRRGLLGQASILTVTSYPNRTSPVERGKWILTNLLGVPPQPPPPNIPPLAEGGADGKAVPLRERMEKHRANPVCAGCHRAMDPIGFAMENFDGVGRWRSKEDGQPIDASGMLFTGAKMDGIAALRREIAARPEVFVGVLTEKMLTYAMGRGIEHYDMPAVRKIVRDARATNYRFSSIVLGVARSVPFQMKEISGAPATESRRASR